MFRLFTLHCGRALKARSPPRRIPRLVHHKAGRITPADTPRQQKSLSNPRRREANLVARRFPPYPSSSGKYWIFLNHGADVGGGMRNSMRGLSGFARIGLMLKE